MKELKLYVTSDIHGYFFQTTYADAQQQNIGLFACASQFQKDENTLMIDAGDMLQGSALATYCHEKVKHPKIIADMLNECGYDVVTIGNHDFNYGRNYLSEYLNHLNANCVCQNVRDERDNPLYPHQILTLQNGLKVGITGAVTDFVNVWEKQENLSGITITSAFEAVRESYLYLKQKCDVTICIYHGGFEKNLMNEMVLSSSQENVACKICEELGFDILITGHQHMHVEGRFYHGTYVLQPKEYGTEFFEIMLQISEKTDEFFPKILIDSKVCYPRSMKEGVLKKDFLQLQTQVEKWLDSPIGMLKEDIIFKDKLHMAQNGNAFADLINEVQLFYSKAQISATSLPNVSSTIPKSVTRRNILTNYPYSNTLVVLEITGKVLKEAIEQSLSYLDYNTSGELTISKRFLLPKVEHYNYDYFAGITFEKNYEKEIGNRVDNLCFKRHQILPNDSFLICLNHYRASGAGGYPMYTDCKIIQEIPIEISDLLIQYLQSQKEKAILKTFA